MAASGKKSGQLRFPEQQVAACSEAFTILDIESRQYRAVKIKDAKQTPGLQQRNYDLRAGGGVARDMPGKLIDVRNHYRFPALRRSPAHATAQLDTHTCDFSLERAKNQFALLEKVETHPIQFGQPVIQNCAHVRGVGETIGLLGKQTGELRVQLLIQLLLGDHGAAPDSLSRSSVTKTRSFSE